MGSEKSPPKSSDSSCANAFLAITERVIKSAHWKLYLYAWKRQSGCQPSKACSTFTASLALVSKYGMPPFDWQKVMALFDEIILLFSSTSILLPRTT